MKILEANLALARKELARQGGHARSRALSKEDRIRIARMGGQAGGRGRRKEEQIPEGLRAKIWELLEKNRTAALWRHSDAALRPRSRIMARLALRDLAKNGSLSAYKAAHELIACL